MNFVFVIVEANQGAPHTDDVVVRVWTEANDSLGFGASRMVVDGVEHPPKDFLRDRLSRTMVSQELMEIVRAKIVRIEFKERLARLSA